jgi:hypothetical protein
VETATSLTELVRKLEERMAGIETSLAALLKQHTVREFYTTKQVAELLGKNEYTVREWCRHGRVHAQKRRTGRGKHPEWVIAHVELERYQREGLLPGKH